MITKTEVLETIVGLLETASIEALEDRDVLVEMTAPRDFGKVREMGRLLRVIYESFDYLKSPEFSRLVDGESEAVRSMRARFASDPVKIRKHGERLGDALSRILDDDVVFSLVPEADHAKVKKVVTLARELANPD